MLREETQSKRSIPTDAPASKGRILVVDDQSQIRRALRTALVARSYEVNDASGGEEAFEKLREEKYDVILLEAVAQPWTRH